MNVAPENFELVDRRERDRAVHVLDRPLLVEAGAGTGKTTLLVDRIVHALEATDVRIGRVVAISFTEKASAELRLRIRRQLEARLAEPDLPPLARERLGRARRDLDQATVSTIHAFAAAMLREQPVQTKLDPRFRVLDELESVRFFREFWDRWLRVQLDDEPAVARLRGALLAGVRLDPDLHQLARELELQRDVVHQLTVPPAVADLEVRMRSFRDGVLACVRHAEEMCRDPADDGLVRLRSLGVLLETLEHLDPTSWPAVFLRKDLSLATTAGRKEGWRAGEAARSKSMRRDLKGRLETLQQDIADDVLHRALAWLERFRDDYAQEKQRRGVLDFQDLLLEARRLVRDDPGVRRDLGERIDMLCVDEFQDTDPLQAELVLFLAEAGGPAHDWRTVRVGPRLFLVGDPKQSIYRFRRADLDVYEECARIVLESGGERLTVRQNFRSRAPVLEWTNAIFEQLFAPVAGEPPGPRHVELEPRQPAGSLPSVWILRPAPGREPETAGEAWRHQEATALVGWLDRALRGGFPVRDAQDRLRPMRPGDVALLFARTSGIELYEEALRAAGLPFRQEGGRLFFRRQEVRDLLHALAAIDDPHDELAIIATLRSPLCGLTDEELWLHRMAHSRFDYLGPTAATAVGERLTLLASLHAERHANGVAGTIASLLDRCEARPVYAARPQGEQALANVEMLERLARQFESARPAGLREFVRSLRDLDEEAPRVGEWTPQDEDAERVRLLTVHVAKGLEFPCVLLANLAAGSNRSGTAVVVDRLAGRVEARLRASELDVTLATAGHKLVSALARRREEAEERRLLYVAATRARDYLVVPRYHGKRAQGLLSALLKVPGAWGEAERFGLLGEPSRSVDDPAGARWCVAERAQEPARPGGRRPPEPRVDLAPLWRRRAELAGVYARRLERGSRGLGETVVALGLGPEDASPGWRRLRRLLAVTLDAIPGRASARELESAVLGTAALHGASDLVSDLLSAMRIWRDSAWAREAGESRQAHYGVRITTARGWRWIEAWLDCVLRGPEGTVIIEWEDPSREAMGEDPAARAEAEARLLWKAVALEDKAGAVREAGRFFLGNGVYVPVEDLSAKLARLREAAALRG